MRSGIITKGAPFIIEMDEMLYHYTSVETLYKIFQNTEDEHIKLRAGYFMNMNDPNDCRYFIQEVSDILSEESTINRKDIEKTIESAMRNVGFPYFISLSQARDSLPMWSMYGKGGHGIAIGFPKKAIDDAVNDYQKVGKDEHKALMKQCFCRLYKCLYWSRDDIKKKFVKDSNIKIDNTGKITGIEDRDICSISYLIKSPDYAYERESRIVFLYSPMPEREYNYMDFYIPLAGIEEIICGPCVEKGFVKAVLPSGLQDRVVESKTPYTDTPQRITPNFSRI